MTTDTVTAFSQLALNKAILKVLDEVGYETPSPIQAETIPLLLQGRDVLGQAQTGTGKTAAFALPILSSLDLKQKDPQVLVLTPTRELAIQVAEAFQKYARHMKGFHVLPVYGGQDYRGQIHALKRGVHVVVGTPGRVMDHMRRGTLKLDRLGMLVLDEADEMLRMGFIDDVEWVLEQTPSDRQIALFSATIPQQIRRIAERHLNNPAQITIKMKTTTAETIRQRYWPVSGVHKLDALTRILEAEHFDAMLVFVRTKTSTIELAEKLEARGYASAALNGDIPQSQRERTVEQLKNGKVDILVATDVAARGLDVARISHVINYDIPYDAEAYVHRIGRTGRAGKKGDAILFVAPREKRLLSTIEKVTRQKIDRMELPSTEVVNDKRIANFKQRITDMLAEEDTGIFTQLIEQYQLEHNVPGIEIAAALARLLQGDTPFLLQHKPQHKSQHKADTRRDSGDKPPRKKPAHRKGERPAGNTSLPEAGMQRYRIEVGNSDRIKPGNIVGAIANEAGLDNRQIGRIDIRDDYSLIDLPAGMPGDVFRDLQKIRVCGKQLHISLAVKEGRPGQRTVASGERKFGKPADAARKRKPGKPASAAKDKKPVRPARRAGVKAKPHAKSAAGAGKSTRKKQRKK